jgi:hypothetical protein
MPLKLSSGSAACEARPGTSGALGPWAEQEQMASTSKSANFIADGMADRITLSFAAPMRVARTIGKHANSGAEFRASGLATRRGASIESREKLDSPAPGCYGQ